MLKTLFSATFRIVSIPLIFVYLLVASRLYAQAPVITGFSGSHIPGSTITISGRNFNDTDAKNIVFFGATQAKVLSATSTTMTVMLDTGSTYEPVTVLNTTNSLIGQSGAFFAQTFANTCFRTRPFNFKPRVVFNTGDSTPFSLVLADLDSDGKSEIIVAQNTARGYITVYKNNATRGVIDGSSFSVAARLGGSLAFPINVKTADFDGDGKKDIVFTEKGRQRLNVFRNASTPGSIAFDAIAILSVAPAIGPQVVGAADFDGDGKIDLAVTCSESDTLCILRNISTPGSITTSSFASPQFVHTGRFPLALAVGQFNGDLLVDVVTTDTGSEQLSVFRNTSTPGTISFATRDSVTTQSCLDVMAADIDADGFLDVVVSNQSGDSIGVLRNISTSSAIRFSPVVKYRTGPTPVGLTASDYDGDGRVDVGVVSLFTGAEIFRNQGGSGIGRTTLGDSVRLSSAVGSRGPINMASGDLDGDTRPDVIIGNAFDHSITVWRNYPLPPNGLIKGDTSLCFANDTATFRDSVAGGYWAVSNPALATISNTGFLRTLAPGVDTVFYNTICNNDTNYAMRIIIIDSTAPLQTITGSDTICIGSAFTLFSTSTGGIWRSQYPTLVSIDSVRGIVRGLASGQSIITYTFANACNSTSDTMVMKVLPIPAVSPIGGGSATICQGFTAVYTDTARAGTWSSSDNTIATVNRSGRVFGVGAGTATISYVMANRCGATARATSPITVNASPSISAILGLRSVCARDTTRLRDTVTGGRWYSLDTAVAVIDSMTGLVRGVRGGSVIVNYTITNSCGTLFDTFALTVNPLADPGIISGRTAVCGTGQTVSLSETVTGGTWSSSNASIASVSTTGTVTSVAASGRAIISYTVTNSCGAQSDTFMFEVQTAANAGTLSGASSVCPNDTIRLRSTVGGGAWSTSNAAIASVNPTGLVFGVATGVATISYTVSNTCNTDLATKVMTVNALAHAGRITGSRIICSSASTTFSDTTASGVWSVTPTTRATIVSTSGLLTGRSVGAVVVSYSVTNACNTAIDTFLVQLEATPSAGTITGSHTTCLGTPIALSSTVAGGTWSSSNTSIATVSSSGAVTPVISGTTIISYSVSNTCGPVSDTFSVSADTAANPGTISGVTSACIGTAVAMFGTGTGGSWSSSAPSIASVSATGTVTAVAGGNAIISYSVTNSCGRFSDTLLFTVIPTTTSGTITGADSVCIGSSVTLSSTVSSGTWATSDATTASVNASGVVRGIAGGTATISFTSTVACSTGPSTFTMHVRTAPAVPLIAGPTSLCAGTRGTETALTAGGTWAFTGNHILLTITSPTAVSLLANTLGSDTLTYSITNACGTTSSAPKIVRVVSASDAGVITGPSIVCAGISAALTDTTANAVGVWSSSAPAIVSINSATGAFIGIAGGAATISYVIPSGTCAGDTAYFGLFINVQPNAGVLTGTDTICATGTNLIRSGGTGDYWTLTDTTAATITSFTGSTALITGLRQGIDSVLYIDTNYCGADTAVFRFYMHPAPPPLTTITGPDSACLNVSVLLSDSVAGGTWSSSNPAIASISSTGTVFANGAGTAVIFYSLTNACTTTQSSLRFKVSNYPRLTGSLTASTCDNALFNTFIPTADSAGASITWSRDAVTGIANGPATGTGAPSERLDNTTNNTIEVKYGFTTQKHGCSSTDTLRVQVNPVPYLVGVKSFAVCSGQPFVFSDTISTGPATSATWSRIPNAGITPATASGIHNIFDTLNNITDSTLFVTYRYNLTFSGCSQADSLNVTVYPQSAQPQISIHSPSYLCNHTMYQNFGTTNKPPNGVQYLWSATGGATIWATGNTQQYILVNFSTAPEGTTDAWVKVRTATSCPSADSFYVSVSPVENEHPEVIYWHDALVVLQNEQDTYQWGYDDAFTLDSTIITGETNQLYTVSDSEFARKYYWVITTRNGCMQKTYYNTAVGVTNVQAAGLAQLSIAPNPSKGAFTLMVNHPMTAKGKMIITNNIGQVVQTGELTTNSNKEVVLDQPAGVYFVTVLLETGRITGRIVITE